MLYIDRLFHTLIHKVYRGTDRQNFLIKIAFVSERSRATLYSCVSFFQNTLVWKKYLVALLHTFNFSKAHLIVYIYI